MAAAKNYPCIRQALILLLFLLILEVTLSIALAAAGLPAGDPAAAATVSIAGVVPILLLGIRRTRAPFKKVCPFSFFSGVVLVPMVLFVTGIGIIVSEVDNILRAFFPMPSFIIEIFGRLARGGISSLLGLLLIAPLTEELLFRGLILRGFLAHYTARKAIFVSSIMFAFIHFNPYQFFGAFVLGVFLAWLFLETGSLLPCVIAHSLANAQLWIAEGILHLDIPGYTGELSDSVQFQPQWFNFLGVILCGIGVMFLLKVVRKEKKLLSYLIVFLLLFGILSSFLLLDRETIQPVFDFAWGSLGEGVRVNDMLLLSAVIVGHTDTVRFLLSKGADVNAAHEGVTALMVAAGKGRADIVKVLLDKGADVNATYKSGLTALMVAARKGHADIVKVLLDKGAHVNATDKDGFTALMAGAWKGHINIVKVLLDKGADVNAESIRGITPLMYAALDGHTDIAKVLLDEGADMDVKSEHGLTALMFAAVEGRVNIVKVLLDKGADVNAKDIRGNTPLMCAALGGHTDIAKVLLDEGADMDVKNEKGKTALTYAREKGFSEIYQLLKKAGARE